MATTLTPIIDDTPSSPTTYNVGMAETFSWIPIQNKKRPLWARATYITNPGDITVSMSAVSVNLADLEVLVDKTNTILSACCYHDSLYQQEVINLLSSTDTQNFQQDVVTLLSSINSASFQISLSADQLETLVDNVENLLVSLTSSNVNVPGFSIPPYTEISLSYYTPTNNIKTANYFDNSTNVMSLSFSYLINPPTSDDALLVNVKKV